MSRREARELGGRAWHVPGSLLLGGGIHADDHHRFAQLAYALHHVGTSFGHTVPKADQNIAGLRHLVIAAHTCGLSKAFPVRGEAARADVVLDGPAKAELIGPTGAAVQHLCDAVALRPECLTQERIIRERA